MLKLILTAVLLTVDIAIVMSAIVVLLKFSGVIAIGAILLWFFGLPTREIAIIAIVFSIGKFLYAWKCQ